MAVGFQSDNPGVAQVSPSGAVKAIRSGTTGIRVTCGGAADVVSVRVAIPHSVAVTPSSLSLVGIGAKGELQGRILDENGAEVPDQMPTWTTSNPAVVTVTAGRLTATGIGKAEVAAALSDLKAAAAIVVDEPPLESVRIDATRFTVRAGEEIAVTPLAVDAQGATVPGAGFRYHVDDEDIATVDSAGHLHGVAHGKTRLTVAAGGARTSVDVEVEKGRTKSR